MRKMPMAEKITLMRKRYLAEREGTTAIEFGLLALPFMLTCISIIELALFFATASMLESAVQDTTRLIKTGQLQQDGGNPLDTFLATTCDKAGFLMNCDDFQYQVQKLDSFSDDLTPTMDEDGNITPPNQFEINQMTAGCVGLVRVIYPYTFITPFFSSIWGEYGNKRLLISTTVFQIEPYNLDASGTGCSV